MAKVKEGKKSLEDIMKDLNKTYGQGSVIHGNNVEKFDEVVSTGSLGLDICIGIGGIPVGNSGKIVEMYGWESCGKSTICQTVIGNYQKLGKKKCLYVDGENSISEDYAKTLGIDLENMLLIQLDEHAGEGAYDKMFALVESGEIGLVIVDSYNSLQPKKLIDDGIGDQTMGLHARMLGKVVMKANTYCTKYGCTFVFIGQLREKIGVFRGSPETTQGGNSLKFYSQLRIEIGRSTTNDNSTWSGEKGKSDKLGNLTKVNVIKNKLGKPFRKAEFSIVYAEGIDKYNELIEIGHDLKILKKYGENITYNENKTPIIEFLQLLKDNDSLFFEIRNKCLEISGIKTFIENKANKTPEPIKIETNESKN